MKKALCFCRHRQIGWPAPALACALGVSLAPVTAQESAAPATTDEPVLEQEADSRAETDYRNWFDVSVGGNLIRGDRDSFRERHGVPLNVWGGVSELHYEADVGQTGLFQLDGRGIFDDHDYDFRVSYQQPDLGFVRAGYREYRSYYDPSGGFLPVSKQWFDLYDVHHLDRGEAFFEAGLTMPNIPRVTFRYAHLFRDGLKDSSIWGDTVATGVPPPNNLRGIVPGFWDIDEDRHILELEAAHKLSDTEFGIAVRYEMSDQDNKRVNRRRPGQTTSVAPGFLAPPDRFQVQRDEMETDLFHIRAFQETWLTERALFTTGYGYTQIDTDLSGSRLFGTDFDPIYDPTRAIGVRQERDEGFHDLTGGSRVDQHVANLNLMYRPIDPLTLVAYFRIEGYDQSGASSFGEFNILRDPGSTLPSAERPFVEVHEDLHNTSNRDYLDLSEGLEARYTGFSNWVLYARGEWLQGEGDLSERQIDLHDGAEVISRDTESSRFTHKYVVGANWYPARRVNLAVQYYHKTRNNNYNHPFDATSNATDSGNRYPAYIRDQDFETDDVNFRITYRPIGGLTLVTRYDFQLSTIESWMDNLEKIEAAEVTTHIIGQNVTWVPLPRLYLQGSFNYVFDRTDTPADDRPADTPRVQQSENDYITATATAGYLLTEKTDLQTTYFFYKADNYSDNSFFGVPYNAGQEEHGASVAVTHRFSPAKQVTLRYGWFTSSDETSGGRNDYEAHMVMASYRYRF